MFDILLDNEMGKENKEKVSARPISFLFIDSQC